MDLSQNSAENIEFMIEAIKKKLKVISGDAIKPSYFKSESYDDIKDIYDIVASRKSFSISEIEEIVDELGRMRKN